jgi:multicomponent Na+:H+ antiporter subunit D
MFHGPSLLLSILATSMVTGVILFFLKEEQARLRTALNLFGAATKVVLVALLVWGTAHGESYQLRMQFMPGLEIVLHADFLALLFGSLSAVLWLVTTIYAVGYLEGSPHRSRFFGFFSLCVAATMGIALAGNLLTFFVFYEMLTVVTYPLVVHRGTGRALAAGRTYLLYTIFGGTLVLVGTVWLSLVAGSQDFATGGFVSELAATRPGTLRAIFAVLIAGLGVKAALVPLHGWLPEAMVAPAPVSALLHAVAVVKAGAFGIIRVVYDVFGVTTAEALGVLLPLAIVAAVSIVYGSLRAAMQDDLKKRLAYSTISQLSYITLGVAIIGPLSTTGGMVHLMHQGIMKITLFFCAGLYAETLGIHRVSEMTGVGRRMPLTTAAFTIAAFGMMGVPPVAGFVSKWYLGLGGVAAGHDWVVAVLVTSSLLNALYFLPVVKVAWFDAPSDAWAGSDAAASPYGTTGAGGRRRRLEAAPLLLGPAMVTAWLSLAAGVLAGVWFGPLGLARMAVALIYPP